MRAILEFGCSRIGFVSGKKISKPWLNFVPLPILNWFVKRWEDIIFTLLVTHQSKDAAYLTPLIYGLGIFFSNEKGQTGVRSKFF